MKNLRIGYLLFITGVVAIILIAGGVQLPKYASRLIVIAVLASVDMLYWLLIKNVIGGRCSQALKIAYWFPIMMLILFFLAGIIIPYTKWFAFPRIYFPGVLLILLIGKGIFLTLLLIRDLIIYLILGFNKLFREGIVVRYKDFKQKSFLIFTSLLATIVMLIFFSGMIFWVRDFKLTTVELKVSKLPKSFDGYRIVQISDLHLGTFLSTKPILSIIKMVNDQHPDLVLFTGDIVNFRTDEAYPFEEVMKEFRARDGIYSILGNHDYGEYNHWNSKAEKDANDSALYDFYRIIGWHLLRNQNVVIKRDTSSIALIGVENWSLAKRFGKRGNVKKAMLGSEHIPFKVLMSHDPSHWDFEICKQNSDEDFYL